MESATVKGLNLENAIEKIESAILRSNPSLKNGSFNIETRKIIIHSNVRHEIDVYVSIDNGKGYTSIFIFEAKNWEAKVGKNEIIIFQEKIKVANAQKGFFVAKEFTKDAQNQAATDPRIELIVASQNFDAQPLFPDFHVISKEKLGEATMEFIARKDNPKGTAESIAIDQERDVITVDGVEQPLKEFINNLYENTVEDKLRTVPSQTYPNGEYQFQHQKTFDFPQCPVVFKGKTYERVEMAVDFCVRVIRPNIIWRFDIATRGRVITFETIETPGGGKLDFSLVAY